eukprot:CAMPEP_0178535502 /NCGR_PEP_ID=MMETSP0696-20121128/35577_1 /TAXON_ID=265572 /ORGANISM="Extubocellulus spinifer, Strain CCMP396" /LENGTH=397 /DNA_ID=CAMNT_0020167641 /DNA_START=73 /DNA_END=1266 /DNA_ORIENTATION=-
MSVAASPSSLTREHIDTFKRTGILVVPHLTAEELKLARGGLEQTLLKEGVDISSSDSLEATGHQLASLSSTNGSGGVLDLFYMGWKLDIALNERLFDMTKQLWRESYCHSGEEFDELSEADQYKWHPFGAFDVDKGYAYIDRIGYRLPTQMAETFGKRVADMQQNGQVSGGNTQQKTWRRKRTRPIQRSLTPHLDCCPDTYNSSENKSKFRPIQCMVSLTDNLEANTGGFEAAAGFHHKFNDWARDRPSSVVNNARGKQSTPAPCIGEYTHIRPNEDSDVFSSIKHIPVHAGDVVFWDNRIPHSNAYKHLGTVPRSVIYCSFLPDVELNRQYVENQLKDYLSRRKPGDQWIQLSSSDEGHSGVNGGASNIEDEEQVDISSMKELSRRLLGIDSCEPV